MALFRETQLKAGGSVESKHPIGAARVGNPFVPSTEHLNDPIAERLRGVVPRQRLWPDESESLSEAHGGIVSLRAGADSSGVQLLFHLRLRHAEVNRKVCAIRPVASLRANVFKNPKDCTDDDTNSAQELKHHHRDIPLR
jgi:hypothetical protein